MKNTELFNYTKELMELFESSSLSAFEYSDGDYSLKLKKGTEASIAPVMQSAPVSVVETPEVAVNDCKEVVVSPIVGTFYQSSSPTADAYVSLGDKVKKGQTLCIVEAMKVMNEIAAPCDGEISEICVSDAEGVEYNQPLFKIK